MSETEGDHMKYTIEQLKSAIQTIKETCQEHFDDCDNCPLCMTEEGGDCYCATDFEWPMNWSPDDIKER